MVTETIGDIEDFPEGRGVPAEVNGVKIAVFNVDGELYAVQDSCPHKNLPLSQIGIEKYRSGQQRKLHYTTEDTGDEDVETRGRINEDKCTIECPWHSLEWDLQSGYNPVRKDEIRTFDVAVDDDGRVEVTV
jgi:nitrite reductase (NADH) small subunit